MYRHRFLGNKLALVELHLCSRDEILADAPQSPSEAMFCLCVPRQVITDRRCIQLRVQRGRWIPDFCLFLQIAAAKQLITVLISVLQKAFR